MRLDDFVERRRRHSLLRLLAFAVVVSCGMAGGVFLGLLHGWNRKADIVIAPSLPPPPVDPIQTGSIPARDDIGGMIEKLDGKSARQHR